MQNQLYIVDPPWQGDHNFVTESNDTFCDEKNYFNLIWINFAILLMFICSYLYVINKLFTKKERSMPSARKQKAREKRCRQSDVMSDVENLDILLETYSKNEINSQLSGNEDNVDWRSNERQTNTNPSGDDFRTLLNTNSIGNSDMTSETVRKINSEITSQVSS